MITSPCQPLSWRNSKIGNNGLTCIEACCLEPSRRSAILTVAPRTGLKGVLLLQAVGQQNAGMRVALACA